MSEFLETISDEIEKSSLETGKIFLFDDITESSSKYVIDRLRYVFFKIKPHAISLYISSYGGDFEACAAIMDEIIGLQSIGAKIYTIAVGKAYSSGANILAVGSERYATPLASMMLHPVSMELPQDYIIQQQNTTNFTTSRYRDVMTVVANRCGKKTKKTIDSFFETIRHGLWMDTKAAIKFGLIDGVWDYNWEISDNDE